MYFLTLFRLACLQCVYKGACWASPPLQKKTNYTSEYLVFSPTFGWIVGFVFEQHLVWNRSHVQRHNQKQIWARKVSWAYLCKAAQQWERPLKKQIETYTVMGKAAMEKECSISIFVRNALKPARYKIWHSCKSQLYHNYNHVYMYLQ